MKGSGEIIRDQRWKVCGEESKLVTLSWRMRWPLRRMRFPIKMGASPNLHLHTLPGTQIYSTHIYTKTTGTQHQIYTNPYFHNPILHKPKYTQPQNKTKHATLGVAQGSSVQPAGPPKGPALVPNQRMDNVTPIYAIWDQYNQGSEIRGLCKWGFCVNLDLCKSGFV